MAMARLLIQMISPSPPASLEESILAELRQGNLEKRRWAWAHLSASINGAIFPEQASQKKEALLLMTTICTDVRSDTPEDSLITHYRNVLRQALAKSRHAPAKNTATEPDDDDDDEKVHAAVTLPKALTPTPLKKRRREPALEYTAATATAPPAQLSEADLLAIFQIFCPDGKELTSENRVNILNSPDCMQGLGIFLQSQDPLKYDLAIHILLHLTTEKGCTKKELMETGFDVEKARTCILTTPRLPSALSRLFFHPNAKIREFFLMIATQLLDSFDDTSAQAIQRRIVFFTLAPGLLDQMTTTLDDAPGRVTSLLEALAPGECKSGPDVIKDAIVFHPRFLPTLIQKRMQDPTCYDSILTSIDVLMDNGPGVATHPRTDAIAKIPGLRQSLEALAATGSCTADCSPEELLENLYPSAPADALLDWHGAKATSTEPLPSVAPQ